MIEYLELAVHNTIFQSMFRTDLVSYPLSPIGAVTKSKNILNNKSPISDIPQYKIVFSTIIYK